MISFFLALFYPVASTFISDQASEDTQGEALGIYHSVQALALILSPLFSGALIGAVPSIVIYLGSTLMVLGGIVFSVSCAFSTKHVHRFD